MIIKGLQKLTLLDFPGKIACTVFTYGCNLRCPFCHNASLVRSEGAEEPGYTDEEILSFLNNRRGRLEGVCITGGEPTLMPDLIPFMRSIRDMGFAIKLDTNGYRPDVLRRVIDEGLCDYVAMDIKNAIDKYPLTTGIPSLDTERIRESVALLKEGRVPFEFRTTVVKELHAEEDLISIAGWLGEDVSYYLQSYADSGDILCGEFTAYSPEQMRGLAEAVRRHLPRVELRG